MTRVAREQRRLRIAFGTALLAASSLPASQACSGSGSSRAGASIDGSDSSNVPSSDGSGDAGAQGAADAPLDCASLRAQGCNPVIRADAAYFSDASDAEMCPLVLACGLPAGVVTSGCEVVDQDGAPIGCRILDDGGCDHDTFAPAACGLVALDCKCDLLAGGGRHPRGHRRAKRVQARDALGAYLARMAEEESVAIEAFLHLRAELEAFGAPAELVAAARRSAADEVRHARDMSRLARERGGVPPSPRRRPREIRSMDQVACENATEGCVRETYGALLAWWQAEHASDDGLRAAFARIARDETRHAAVSWAVARWIEPRLDAAARARVERARKRTGRELARRLSTPMPDDVLTRAGFPRPAQARTLLRAVRSLLPPPPPAGHEPKRAAIALARATNSSR